MRKFGELSLLMLLTMLLCAGVAGTASAAGSKSGIVKENGVSYYYKNGKKVKNKIGVKVGSRYYSVDSKGVATRIKDKTLGMASVKLTELGITPDKASKNASLKTAFKWCYKSWKYTAKSAGWSKTAQNAQQGLKTHKGNCYVQAATFYYMAKALGYDNAKYVRGYYAAAVNSKGKVTSYAKHAWVRITMKGTKYIFDPNFAYVYHVANHNSSAASGYKMTYTKAADEKKTQYRYYTTKKKLLK